MNSYRLTLVPSIFKNHNDTSLVKDVAHIKSSRDGICQISTHLYHKRSWHKKLFKHQTL